MKRLFIIFWLVLSFQVLLGQEKMQAEFIDESSPNNCCDLDSRLETFKNGLAGNVNDRLFIIIHYGKNDFFQSLYYERVMLSEILESKNITLIRGQAENKLRIEFWKVPNGADLPFSREDKSNFVLANLKKPVIFADNDDTVCSTSGKEKHFLEILLANPNLRGKIVIRAKNKLVFNKKAKEFLEDFTNNFNVNRKQLTTFFLKDSQYEHTDYWLIPRRSSK